MLMTQAAFAHEYSFYANASTGQRIYYKINGSNVAVCFPNTILPYQPWNGYTKPTGDLIIPSSVTYNGTTYSVTEIGQSAFDGCSGLTSVTIPNTVTKVCINAFLGCSGLVSIALGSTVSQIGQHAFEHCNSLTSVTIPNSVTFIDNFAFHCCTSLTSVTLGNSLTLIGQYAFRHCTSLTSLTIPNSVLTIELSAFDSCSNLTSVTIGNSVNQIGSNPFKNCRNLNTIVVSSENNYFDSRDNCNAIIKTTTNELISGCRNTVIPNTVTAIAPHSFQGCRGLYSLTIPSSVCSIGTCAFYCCSNLTRITSLAIEAPVISWGTFYEVSSTIPVYIPCGSAFSYDPTWNYFSNRIETFGFSLNVTSDNHTMGYAQILSGPNCSDSLALISATAYNGYHFTNWSDGNTDNPRQIIVTQDLGLTAYFAIDTFSVVVVSSDLTQGRVEGGGEFVYHTTCTIEATADSGYHFDHWSTGVTDNPYSFLVTSDTTITAFFEANGGNEGFEVISKDNIKIFYRVGSIIVEGTSDEVHVFDMTGRSVRNKALPAGVYMVKVGERTARKVVVMW